jgi:hypothetical protein
VREQGQVWEAGEVADRIVVQVQRSAPIAYREEELERINLRANFLEARALARGG